jgi:hypothetical protein
MLNLRVAGNFLSTYYLADATQFLRAERGNLGEATREEGLRQVRRLVRRASLDLDDHSTLAATRKSVVPLLAAAGFGLDTGTATRVDDELAADAVVPGPDNVPLSYVVLAPASQHLDANPAGRRQSDARPQRRLERLLRHGYARFGIVTNGRELRVVAKDPGLGGEAAYLAFDLVGLADCGDEHEWRLFWALLRPEAMLPGPDGTSLYERAERASVDAAARVSDDLSVGVRKAIEALAQGAMDDLRARDAEVPDLRELFGDALTVAYRLLFVAFVEDRGLLPVDVPAYRFSYGFGHLRDEVLAPGAEWTGDRSYLWESATALFRLLRDGADVGEFRVAAYNGGLFGPQSCRWFDLPIRDGRGEEQPVRLSDRQMATAIEHLSITETVRGRGGRVLAAADGGGRRRVNYRELSVEQLGSVYEGLLAFEPRLAREPMVMAELRQGAKRATQIVSRDRLPEGAQVLEEVPEGRFYLFEASGQRKGSGSYYTPRAICAFLAREALEPLVAGRSSKEILDLRVIDPAMGSGAFLVVAVHFLAEAYGQARITEGLDADNLIDDEERAAYRRVVVERCIYGVDKNPMAVELAKVSLWLATASADRPLSFLDAKLRCGDSLVGAFLDDLDRLPPVLVRGRKDADEAQLRLPVEGARADLARLANGRREIAEAPSDHPIQVQEKAARLRRYVDADGLRRLRLRATLWVSAFYWPKHAPPLSASEYRAYMSYAAEHGVLPLRAAQDAVDEVASEVRPFHWELEFPEAFFEPDGTRRADAGFDAIVGNPPWESIRFKLGEFYGRFEPSFAFARTKEEKSNIAEAALRHVEVKEAFESSSARVEAEKAYIKKSDQYRMLGVKGAFNYYRAFLERDLRLLASRGILGLIIDAGLVGDAGTQYHRRELFEQTRVRVFALFDNSKGIFPIHRSEQFVVLVTEKGGTTERIPFASGLTEVGELDDLTAHTTPLAVSLVRTLAPDTMAIPDIREQAMLSLVAAIYGEHHLLYDEVPARGWIGVHAREFNIEEDREFFERQRSGTPLREGKHIHQFMADYSEPTYRLNPEGDEELIRRERRRAGYRGQLLAGILRSRGERRLLEPNRRSALEVPMDQYRLGFRDVASATNERTLIAAIIPSGTALAHSVPFMHRSIEGDPDVGYETLMDAHSMLYLCGVLNSLVMDFVVRRKVTGHLTKSIMATLPIPDPPAGSDRRAAIVWLAGRLTCRSPAFDDLAGVLGMPCGPLDRADEVQIRAELDAHVAHLYRLSKDQLVRVLADFRRSRGEGTPVPPDDAYKETVVDYFDQGARDA